MDMTQLTGMDTGSIATLASGLKHAENLQSVGTALLAKSLDDFEQAGDSMVSMMERSVNPAVGGNVDISL